MVLESEWVFGSVNRWVFRGGFVGLNQNGSEDCVGFEFPWVDSDRIIQTTGSGSKFDFQKKSMSLSQAVYGIWVFGVLMVIVSFSRSLMAWTSSAMVAW